MLLAFLPSWLQDLSGAAATLNTLQVVNRSLFPLLFIVPLLIVAFLLFARTETSGRPEAGRRKTPIDPADHRIREAVKGSTSLSPEQIERSQSPLVLVVDDSAVVRGRLSRLLTGAGFGVINAGDGQQALDLIQGGQIPSVLITDLEMPIMDGFGLVAAVQGGLETEHVPIIAITGHDDLQARVADLSGIYGIFSKPWNDRALLRRVQGLAAMAEAGTTTP